MKAEESGGTASKSPRMAIHQGGAGGHRLTKGELSGQETQKAHQELAGFCLLEGLGQGSRVRLPADLGRERPAKRSKARVGTWHHVRLFADRPSSLQRIDCR